MSTATALTRQLAVVPPASVATSRNGVGPAPTSAQVSGGESTASSKPQLSPEVPPSSIAGGTAVAPLGARGSKATVIVSPRQSATGGDESVTDKFAVQVWDSEPSVAVTVTRYGLGETAPQPTAGGASDVSTPV